MQASRLRQKQPSAQQAILAAAIDLFADHGPNGVTTKQIALAAGKNEALIFRHFGSKEKLYSAVMTELMSHKDATLLAEFNKLKNQSLPKALLGFAKALIKTNTRDLRLMRMVMHSALQNHTFARDLFAKSMPVADFLEAFFAKQIQLGHIVKSDPNELCHFYMGWIHHYILTQEIIKAKRFFPKSSDQTIKRFIDIFLRGIQS